MQLEDGKDKVILQKRRRGKINKRKDGEKIYSAYMGLIQMFLCVTGTS